ncbi:calmodulin-regulated spectrin-associated protein 2a isoform X2 [Pimephales promelas]|uniref:calmodulin-regulated spectrin-associated protein 2a isoform X2 n=1 Tax=Pimephales promelas TaxID=90988 RepID=UPI001955511C|nr:calmodulin-regulated spectrin-associated protein 2a isoform X2 [Pimephales promelas]KAG1939673.1 calmodulin-regulated spectrin-associated protein [Pimephales promelas]
MGDLTDSRDPKKTFIVPAIKSFDHYDFNRAKIRASLTWLVAKAFGTDSVPEDLKEPLYLDQYEQEHLKPPVADLLLSAELYCRAGSLILKSDAVKPLLGHDAVIQALAQKGLYVTDQERLVTERDLQKKPIQMSAHLAMIDTLMMAYTVETVSVEKVMACMQQYSTDYLDGDVPYDTEDAVTSWMNKVNEYLKEIISQEQRRMEAQNAEPVENPKSPTKWYMKLVPARYRKEQALHRTVPWIPPVDNLLKDSTDGCALAALLHFYCPAIINLGDIFLKETMSLADSLYNLHLIQDFCREHLNHCCHFNLEDMLYAHSSIKNNYLVFMAELFWWFEVVKPPFVEPQALDIEAPAPSLKNLPSVPISKVTKRSFMERPPSPDRPSLPLRPQPQTSGSGEIRRSTSMSFVDSFMGTWPKEKKSAAQGVSFEIPFDKERTNQTPTGRGMTRSASTEGFGFKMPHGTRGIKRNLSFQPINGKNMGIEEEVCPDGQSGNLNSRLNGSGPPSIEEALEIIHNSEKQSQSPRAQAAGEGFFLHLQSKSEPNPKAKDGELDSVSESFKGVASSSTTEVDTGIHVRTEDIQETLDEDSSLRDCTVSIELDTDQDFEAKACHSQGSTSPCPSSLSAKSPAGSIPTPAFTPGIKMTSFAEQKFRKLNPNGEAKGSASQGTTPDGSDLGIPHSVSWAPSPDISPAHQPSKDPAQTMAAEMVQLRMRLEEKRRAIEAQKKKVEAAFTRHRQKMGRSAFLTVVKRKGVDGTSPSQENTPSSEGSKTPTETPQPDKSPLKSAGEDGTCEADLMEYTRSIEKLNSSLSFLQTEMQRLAQQQEVIMQMREQQAWVVLPPQLSPQKQVRELRGSGARSSGSPSPADSPRATHRSPTNLKRKSASFHSKTPRTPRPNELKITPFNRVLNVPQSVDSIPRLRRFSPSQSVSCSFTYLGSEKKPPPGAETTDKDIEQGIESLSIECSYGTNTSPTKETQQAVTEDTGESKNENKPTEERENLKKSTDELKPAMESSVSEVLSQIVMETVIVTPTEPFDIAHQTNKNLIEVPLSVLKPLDGQALEEEGENDTSGENQDDEQKMCRGFFFKDDMKGEDSMAVKRAALLEKRLRRERESQQRKQQLELELEQKKEEARLKAEEDRTKKEEDKARREFIKQEYLRRKQLKLMEDMDTLVKPRPAGAKQRKPRPKSIHRDVMESPRTPVRATAVSSLSLASLGDNDSVSSDKKTPSRPDSADGCLSPTRSSSRNGEKDWENGSTTSSLTSNTEYTGPKLYKEPSAKSNKHIIQNALAHCCLAGKVNEGQKNKILEEMEKSGANNFLVLFRDSGCQFRSLYTYCPEMEEINKLAGIGPKTISRKMIDGLYKYNSDRKQFSQIPAKTMSASVDAITIHSHLWQTKKPGTPKKVAAVKS